ncbi:hypothetical protein C2U55_16360 [Enterobacteriaceae bacterium ENNIH3]|jgi:hypothetical protein|nr:hypothetical protein C2U55_16360 [Enterobacteriaceae bacterium ENNIH3]AUV09379.1 hypothetical protein C2U52_25535 [Enterobacteriaceae bacterium ENNIH2]PWF51006.1 hypothetical protein BHT19_0008610 [[Kluyvera] intestini]
MSKEYYTAIDYINDVFDVINITACKAPGFSLYVIEEISFNIIHFFLEPKKINAQYIMIWGR